MTHTAIGRLLPTLLLPLVMPTACGGGTGPEGAPPPERGDAFWTEDWETAPLGSYLPGQTIRGRGGAWVVDHDPDPSCGPNSQRAEIVGQNGSRVLRLVTECTSVWVYRDDLAVPIEPDVAVSFSGTLDVREMPGRFTRRSVALALVSSARDRNPSSTAQYALYHEAEPTDLPYHKVFSVASLADGRRVVRRVLDDFRTIRNFSAAGSAVQQIAFVLELRGTATFGDVAFSRGDAGSLRAGRPAGARSCALRPQSIRADRRAQEPRRAHPRAFPYSPRGRAVASISLAAASADRDPAVSTTSGEPRPHALVPHLFGSNGAVAAASHGGVTSDIAFPLVPPGAHRTGGPERLRAAGLEPVLPEAVACGQ
jgi:hypothetical protein